MAKMARTHHINVQRDDPGMRPPAQRELDIQTALDSIQTKATEDQAGMLGARISRDECELALRFSKNGTSPGVDGIQFEVWKTLDSRFVEDARHENRQTFDVMAVLNEVFEDIQQYGVCDAVPFAKGSSLFGLQT
ncbi:hypothetical protein LXA43DRAFT_976759 [Ganoderma leucocontextum]|nr:hypothetical protein LXA43DRAFT_976759 [Ganoderma leucocontextum]